MKPCWHSVMQPQTTITPGPLGEEAPSFMWLATSALEVMAFVFYSPARHGSYNWMDAATPIVDTGVDVHGISHYNTSTYLQYHAEHPNKPMISSECCSCETMRDQNHPAPGDKAGFDAFDGACLQQQVGDSGLMGWALKVHLVSVS